MLHLNNLTENVIQHLGKRNSCESVKGFSFDLQL